jgi:hypothetical protein
MCCEVLITSPLHIGYILRLLILNILNRSDKTFIIISDLHSYFNNLNSELFEHDTKIESPDKILSHSNIGSVIKLDDIYYTIRLSKKVFPTLILLPNHCAMTKRQIKVFEGLI